MGVVVEKISRLGPLGIEGAFPAGGRECRSADIERGHNRAILHPPASGTLPLWRGYRPTNGNGTIKLTEAQIEIIGRFNDLSFENPNLTFEEVVLKEVGPDLFPPNRRGGCSRRNAARFLTESAKRNSPKAVTLSDRES